MPELESIRMTRIVARPAALDAARWPDGTLALRVAPDEVLLTTSAVPEIVGDPHAIVQPEDGFVGGWVSSEQALHFLERSCEWELPRERPAFAQGSVAGLPVKLWFEKDRVLFLAPEPYASDLQERMA